MWLKTRLLEIVEDVRNSYWFVPSLFALAGLLLGLGLVYLDAVIGDAWLGRYEWLYGSRPAGARALLSTVAGSTITVAGVVFSITLAAVTYASGQYGPRLLSNFVRDRGNQVTLGVFIGTFLYCLVVLRTIRSAAEASADTAGAVRESFVPHAAMFGALALAVLSIGVLIYFVHHVTDGIHINNVIARIGRGLLRDIAERRDHIEPDDGAPVAWSEAGEPVPAAKTGYVEAVDEDALLDAATDADARITLLVRPGDFVHRGRPLLLVHSGEPGGVEACGDLFSIGRKRSGLQDLRFPIDELVELAARALSPGVNDPFTAISCVDWLGAALDDLAALPDEPVLLRDADGRARVRAPRLRFADYLEVAVGRLRPYVVGDVNVVAHLSETLERVEARVVDPARRALVALERARVREAHKDKKGQE